MKTIKNIAELNAELNRLEISEAYYNPVTDKYDLQRQVKRQNVDNEQVQEALKEFGIAKTEQDPITGKVRAITEMEVLRNHVRRLSCELMALKESIPHRYRCRRPPEQVSPFYKFYVNGGR